MSIGVFVLNLWITLSRPGHSSRQHRRPEGGPPVGHQRQRDDQGFPQAQDQGRPWLRHQGPDQGKTFYHSLPNLL